MTSQSFDTVRDAVTRIVRDHWRLFLIEGIILVVLGLLAVAVPMVASLAVTILFGWLFLISGIVGLITTFVMGQAPGFPPATGGRAIPKQPIPRRRNRAACCRGGLS